MTCSALSGSRRERSLELATARHLQHNVAAADQLAAHVQLRICGPVAEGFEARADGLVAQNVKGRKGNLRRAKRRNELSRGGPSSALRRARTSVARTASTTLRLKPHFGSAGEPAQRTSACTAQARDDVAAARRCGAPFMKSMTGAEASSVRMRASTSSAAAAAGTVAALSSDALSSPLPAISSTMSQPPMSSPRTYSCGYVGQLLYDLRLSRTAASLKMSKWPKLEHPAPRSASTTLRLKPHFGSSGEPARQNEASGQRTGEASTHPCLDTWRQARRAFHEQHHGRGVHQRRQSRVDVRLRRARVA